MHCHRNHRNPKIKCTVTGTLNALSPEPEDTQIAAPRGIEDIRRDPEVAADLAAGAFLIAVPLIENDTRVVRANITLECGMLKAIDKAAKQRKLTRSAFLAQAARHEIERQ